jgi:hypothetical protein
VPGPTSRPLRCHRGRLAARAAWGAWGAVALLSLALTLLALPVYFRQYSTLGLFASAEERQVARDSLAQFGLSPGAFAWYAVACQGLRVLVSFAVAALIVRAKAGGMALFVSALLMAMAAGRTLHVTPQTEAWGWPAALVTATAHAGLVLFFYLFPDGRFAPRWTRWLALLWGAALVPASLFPSAAFGLRNWPNALYLAVLAAVLATGVAAQVYRYRRVAGPAARRQIKWVLYGAAVLALIALAYAALDVERPRSVRAVLDPQIRLHDVVGLAVGNLALLSVPLSVGIAVLRHHLWDVDVVISRTLVYVPLTAIVAGLYVASITLCQRLLVVRTGQQSDAAVVLITLLVTALINPLNLGVQKLVDRRFKESPRPLAKLTRWGEDIASAVYDLNGRQVLRRLLEEAGEALGAESGAAYLTPAGRPQLVHRFGAWTGRAPHLTVPLDAGGVRLGVLRLGARRGGAPYRPHELEALRRTAGQVARALHQRGDLPPCPPPAPAASGRPLAGTPDAPRVPGAHAPPRPHRGVRQERQRHADHHPGWAAAPGS